jgi:hypothetical protein
MLQADAEAARPDQRLGLQIHLAGYKDARVEAPATADIVRVMTLEKTLEKTSEKQERGSGQAGSAAPTRRDPPGRRGGGAGSDESINPF